MISGLLKENGVEVGGGGGWEGGLRFRFLKAGWIHSLDTLLYHVIPVLILHALHHVPVQLLWQEDLILKLFKAVEAANDVTR
jgi:hypothetical protein